MFSELGGQVQVQGAPRAGVSVATYTNGGLSSVQLARGVPFTGNVILLGAETGPHGYYLLRQVNIQPPYRPARSSSATPSGGSWTFTPAARSPSTSWAS